MLSDQILELLTAFVDGELSQRQRKAVMRILERSSEAREMLRQLQEGAHKIKKLPRHKVEPSLVAQVMEAIAERQAQLKPAAKKATRRAWRSYLVVTMAASVLIAAIGLAYWSGIFDPAIEDVGSGKWAKTGHPAIKPGEPKLLPETPKKKLLDPFKMVEGVALGVGATPVEQVYAAMFDELRNAKGSPVSELAEKLNAAKTAVHVDVTVKNNALAMDRLRDVLREGNIHVVTDPAVTKTLNDKKQLKVEYLVFAENLRPDAVARLMSELSQEFIVSKNNNQRTEQSPYEKLAVKPIGNEGKQQLAKLLGAAPVKSAAKAAPVAVLLPGIAPSTPSAEVQRFIDHRHQQPGTLQILIRIHQE